MPDPDTSPGITPAGPPSATPVPPAEPAPSDDPIYARIVRPYLSRIDNGTLFKQGFILSYVVLAWSVLLLGAFGTLTGLFGERGYFTYPLQEDFLTTWQAIGGVLGTVGGLYSLITALLVYCVIRARARELQRTPYVSMVDFFLNHAYPWTLALWGELSFVLSAYGALGLFTTTILGAPVYTPLGPLTNLLLAPVGDEFDLGLERAFGNFVWVPYDNFSEGLVLGSTSLAAGFATLILAYLAREVWCYGMRVATAFVGFLPRFAIPLRIRHTAEAVTDK